MLEKFNTLSIFFDKPTHEYNVREVARVLNISPPTASTALKKLEKSGFLKKRRERLLKLYRANIENDLYQDAKRFYTIRKIKETGLLDAINMAYLKPTVVLFGSAAYGLDTETSDLDILIVSEKTDEFGRTEEFEKKLKRRLQFFVVRNVKDLKNKHLINNVLNGMVLQGEVKWI